MVVYDVCWRGRLGKFGEGSCTRVQNPTRPAWNPSIVIQGKMDDERSVNDRIGMRLLFHSIRRSIAAYFS